MTLRLDLNAIDHALRGVEEHWAFIDAELQRQRIGRKDAFTSFLRDNMLSAYAYLDELLAHGVELLSESSTEHILALNERVHYGTDQALMAEYASAIVANRDKVLLHIGPIRAWHARHYARGAHPYKLAAEAYVSILGRPQLFIEGNHRTGSLIASWINLSAGYTPFVLSTDNAIAYFAPSCEIKHFADRTTWRGRARLPKYHKKFRAFWERHVDNAYVLGSST